MARSVHEVDPVNVNEQRPEHEFGVDVAVDVRVVGFIIWLRLGRAVTQWFIPLEGGRRTR